MDKPQPDNLTFFFDDVDSNAGFTFVKPTVKHQKDLNLPPALSISMTCKNVTSGEQKQGFYSLHGMLLVYYQSEFSTSCQEVLEINNSRLASLSSSLNDTTFGFTLAKNGNSFEFQISDKQDAETWITALRSVCILPNFHEEYKASKMIGKGSFAKVYLVDGKIEGKQYAVKAFAKAGIGAGDKSNARATMINEIDIMRALDHENIIKLHEVFETERSIYLVMELIQGKPLQTPLTKLTFKKDYSERQVTEMIRSILDALAYLASKGIMHRDLKPDNILVDKTGKLKIVDFGLATYIDVSDYIFKKCGTPGYIAPEVFRYNPKIASSAYNDACDVFSAGCILFYMLYGDPFFDGAGASEILQLNREYSEFEALYFLKKEIKNNASKINKDALDLLVKLLEYDHKKRISAAQALSHEYFAPTVKEFNRANSFKDTLNECPSPTVGSMNSEKGSPNLQKSGNRFTEKDSLYLDVGKPDLNGNIDTLSNGSANNSLMITRNDSALSNNNSVSTFAKHINSPDKETKGQNFTFKVAPNNNQTFLKAAIFNTMQKNNEGATITKKARPTYERRHTDNELPHINDLNLDMKSESTSSEMDESNSEESQIQAQLAKINERTPRKHPSKLVTQNEKQEHLVQ